MAIYHFSVQVISRGKGKSSVGAAAYRAGEKLFDERQQLTHDYTKKHGVEHTEIIAPVNAPEWVMNRSKLWNEVEKIEKASNSQLAREINIALPAELTKDQRLELVRSFAKENFSDNGMVVDLAIHNNRDGNPHAHIMLTMRPFNEDGSWGAKAKKEYILDKDGQKIKLKSGEYKSRKVNATNWDERENLEKWRENWSKCANKALEKVNIPEKIDHRSYKDQGVEQIPQIHLGNKACKAAKKGKESIRYNRNEGIKKANEELKTMNKEKILLLKEYKELKAIQEKEIQEDKKYAGFTESEKDDIKKAEKLLMELPTIENLSIAAEKLNGLIKSEKSELHDLEAEECKLLDKISKFKYWIELINKSETELKNLPTNFLGRYKDSSAAALLQGEIITYKHELKREGCESIVDLRLKETKAVEIKNKKESLNKNINNARQAQDTIKKGIEVLEIKKIREFVNEYRQHFPQIKYCNYDGIKAIQAVNKLAGKNLTVNGIKELEKIIDTKIKSIENGKLKEFKDTEDKLETAERNLNIVERYKDVVEKGSNKIIGKKKYQEEHSLEIQSYYKALKNLIDCGIASRAGLSYQKNIYEKQLKNEKPVLDAQIKKLKSDLNLVYSALVAISNAIEKERHQEWRKEQTQHRAKAKTRELDMEDDLEL